MGTAALLSTLNADETAAVVQDFGEKVGELRKSATEAYDFMQEGLSKPSASRAGRGARMNQEDPSNFDNNKKKRQGRSKNKNRPDQNAIGDHSTITKDNNGNIKSYSTWKKNSRNPSGWDEVKSVHIEGSSHNGIETPHTHIKGQKNPYPSLPEELPKQ